MSRPTHYNVKKRNLLLKSPLYTIHKDILDKLSKLSIYESQSVSKIVHSAILFYLMKDKNEEIYQKIKLCKKYYKNRKKIQPSKSHHKKNKKTIQKPICITKLFD
ncbi:hypothetical protein [Helicobacter sp. 13S00477-4]|uniref:hypothetical protein n=1 Tax=Helicobacter sp. 13S00477-4 TaxID=1905759 RepID=UPI000BA70E4C|nr:hypothetical protein [Helicobacter sp. 13S00477-4]PAF51979.1 hypothetical protein BKH44_04785 [Helicobacter sp. 13S00477-4]